MLLFVCVCVCVSSTALVKSRFTTNRQKSISGGTIRYKIAIEMKLCCFHRYFKFLFISFFFSLLLISHSLPPKSRQYSTYEGFFNHLKSRERERERSKKIRMRWRECMRRIPRPTFRVRSHNRERA